MFFYLLLLSLPACLFSLTCTSCPFKLDAPHSLSCSETCQGDVCYIVVNNYFNGTVIAGCISASSKDSKIHQGTSVCHRQDDNVLCACTSSDKCNDPMASLSDFEFTEDNILEGEQIFPQVQPTEAPVEMIDQQELRAPEENQTTMAPVANATVARVETVANGTRMAPGNDLRPSNETEVVSNSTLIDDDVNASSFASFAVLVISYLATNV